MKQSLFQRFSKKKINFKKNDFVTKPSYVQKSFSHYLHKNEGFHNSKCVCHCCNKIGHLSFNCPIKKIAHFGAKLIWVPKTNHKGPKTKRVPNSV